MDTEVITFPLRSNDQSRQEPSLPSDEEPRKQRVGHRNSLRWPTRCFL